MSAKRSLASPSVVRTNYDMFREHLLESIPPLMSRRFYAMYEDAWKFIGEQYPDLTDDEDSERLTLKAFQLLLGVVPDWDAERIDEETQFLLRELTWMREVLRQMLVAHVTILMSVRDDERTNGDLQFEMPPNEQIVHRFYCDAAKKLRGKAYLYSANIDADERVDRIAQAEDIIRSSLDHSINRLVPLDQVVQSHLVERVSAPVEAANDDDEEAEEHAMEEPSDEDDDDNDESSNEQAAPEPVEQAVMALDPTDVPADTTAAVEAIVSGDSDKAIKLKQKASGLREMLESLRRERARLPRGQKSRIAALDEEIAYREQQLSRTKKKIGQTVQ